MQCRNTPPEYGGAFQEGISHNTFLSSHFTPLNFGRCSCKSVNTPLKSRGSLLVGYTSYLDWYFHTVTFETPFLPTATLCPQTKVGSQVRWLAVRVGLGLGQVVRVWSQVRWLGFGVRLGGQGLELGQVVRVWSQVRWLEVGVRLGADIAV